MPVRRLNHAVLYVNGLDREVDFYTRTLGFEVRLQIPGQAAFLRSPGSANDHDLGLFDVGAGHADGRPSVGLYHLAWEVGTLAELVETRQKLVDAGALVGESDHRLSKSLYAKDPSGIEFEVLWRVPVEDWESELAQGDGYTVPLDWDRTLTRWDTARRPAPRPAPRPDRPGREAPSDPLGQVRPARRGLVRLGPEVGDLDDQVIGDIEEAQARVRLARVVHLDPARGGALIGHDPLDGQVPVGREPVGVEPEVGGLTGNALVRHGRLIQTSSASRRPKASQSLASAAAQ